MGSRTVHRLLPGSSQTHEQEVDFMSDTQDPKRTAPQPSNSGFSATTYIVAGLIAVLAVVALGVVAYRHAHRVTDSLAVSDPQGDKACKALAAAFLSTDSNTKITKIVETSNAALKSTTPEISSTVTAKLGSQRIADATKLRAACVSLGYDIPKTPNTALNPSPAATPGG
jgi:hypothetical protein